MPFVRFSLGTNYFVDCVYAEWLHMAAGFSWWVVRDGLGRFLVRLVGKLSREEYFGCCPIIERLFSFYPSALNAVLIISALSHRLIPVYEILVIAAACIYSIPV